MGDLSVKSESANEAKAKATGPKDAATKPDGRATSSTIFKAATALGDVNSMSSVQELANYIRLQQYGKMQAEIDERVSGQQWAAAREVCVVRCA